MKGAWAVAVAAVATGGGSLASAQDFDIYLMMPQWVIGGESFTVEVWGQISGGTWVDDTSAMAGFGVDVLNTGGAMFVNSIGGSVIAPWAAGFGTDGTISGIDLVGTSGGQLANLFGILNPGIDMSNPILLFTFDVHTLAGPQGLLTYTPGNPNPNGGLSFYPISTDGASVIAPNDVGTTLTFYGATIWVVPEPSTLALLAVGGAIMLRRR